MRCINKYDLAGSDCFQAFGSRLVKTVCVIAKKSMDPFINGNFSKLYLSLTNSTLFKALMEDILEIVNSESHY